MIIENLLELAGETFARAEWVALFLGVTGAYWLGLGFSGLRLGHTRGFGWRAEEALGAGAWLAGAVWAVAGAAVLSAALTVWVVKA